MYRFFLRSTPSSGPTTSPASKTTTGASGNGASSPSASGSAGGAGGSSPTAKTPGDTVTEVPLGCTGRTSTLDQSQVEPGAFSDDTSSSHSSGPLPVFSSSASSNAMPRISASNAASPGASGPAPRRSFSSETRARRAKEAGNSSSSGSKSGSGCSKTSGPVQGKGDPSEPWPSPGACRMKVPIRAARPRQRCTDSHAAARRQ
mmetsp:Transcript_33232/g.53352  ORF Transcript_33232/g.53352 Transcript_33232/m.53352 type:complete len:203 (-) Transcript_33232:521-1129(-)